MRPPSFDLFSPPRFALSHLAFPSLSFFLAIACLTGAGLRAAGSAGFNYTVPINSVVQAVAADAAGNAYLTGHTNSPSFPVTAGTFQTQFAGGQCNPIGPALPPNFTGVCDDAFVIKLDPTGAVVWATYLGGNGEDSGQAIAVDASGNVYVAGVTQFAAASSPNTFPTTPGSAFPSTVGDGFLVKLDPSGSRMIYGSFIPDYLTTIAMAIDANGNAYVATVNEPAAFRFPATAGAYQDSSSAHETGVILKLNAAGSALVWATYLGGKAPQDITHPTAITVDASGNAYVTGLAPGDFPVTAGAFQAASAGGAFVAKLNATGTGLIYSTFLGSNDEGAAIKVDSQGRAYVLGQVNCTGTCPLAYPTDFPATAGAFEAAGAMRPTWANLTAGVSPFLASLSANGSALVYGTYVEGALVLDVNASGDAYVAGLTAGSGLPASAGATEPCYDANDYAAEFDPTGALVGATYFGAPGAFALNSLVARADGQVSIAIVEAVAAVDTLLIDDPRQPPGQCVSPMIQNAANYYNYGTQVAPGELVTLQGVGMGPQTGTPGTPGPDGLLPTTLAGVQVMFGSVAAPLLYAQAGQINAQAPWEIAGQSSVQVRVIYNGTAMNSFNLTVVEAAPGLFYLSYPSRQAAVLNADGSVNSTDNPARAGDVIALFGTGAGPTSPGAVTDGIWGPGSNTLLNLPVTVQIGGVDAPVLYAGAAPGLMSGFFQVNVAVPAGVTQFPNASINLYLGLQGSFTAATTNQATVAVR